jgi:hypothetical protein
LCTKESPNRYHHNSWKKDIVSNGIGKFYDPARLFSSPTEDDSTCYLKAPATNRCLNYLPQELLSVKRNEVA